VENNNVSNQSRHENTRRFRKISSNGILVRFASTQKEVTKRKEQAKEKPREQQYIE
jgi:hypothetical protein